MTLHSFAVYAAAYYVAHPAQRYGQAMFNALYETHPDIANEIRGTDVDPFYFDARLSAFWAFVGERLA